MLGAFKDTLDIFAFRLASRPRIAKLFIVIGIIVILGTLLSITHMGTSIRMVAGSNASLQAPGSDETYSSIVLGYLRTFTINDSVYAVSGVFVALLGSLLLIPLSGYSYAGIIPAGDLVTVKRTDYHLVTDSIVLQFLSFVALIQVGFLTFLGAILTITADHPGRGIIANWGIWALVVLLTSVAAWLFEYLHRRFGAWSKYALVALLTVGAGSLVLLAPRASFELFGLSRLYTNFLRWLDAAPVVALPGVVIIFLLLATLFIALAWFVGTRTIALQDRSADRQGAGRFALLRRRSHISQLWFLLNLVTHQRNIFRPLVFAVISLSASIIAVGGNAGILYGLPVIIPLIVSLSWGVNTFGIIGGGTAWLVSQPRSKRTILFSIAGVQLIIVGTITLTISLLEVLLYHIPLPELSNFVLITLAVSVYMTRSAVEKAVKGPERYKVHIRNEQVLPPGKAIGYIARFFVGGALVIGLMVLVGNVWLQVAVLALICAWSYLRLRLLTTRWSEDPEIVQHIIATVGY